MASKSVTVKKHKRGKRGKKRHKKAIRKAIRKALAKQGGGGSAGTHPKVASPAQMGGPGFDAVPDSNTLTYDRV